MQLLLPTTPIHMSHRPLPRRRHLDIRQTLLSRILRHIPDLLERHRRHEGSRLPRLGLLGIHFIDLLEGKAFTLVDQAPNKKRTDETKASPEEEDLGA